LEKAGQSENNFGILMANHEKLKVKNENLSSIKYPSAHPKTSKHISVAGTNAIIK